MYQTIAMSAHKSISGALFHANSAVVLQQLLLVAVTVGGWRKAVEVAGAAEAGPGGAELR